MQSYPPDLAKALSQAYHSFEAGKFWTTLEVCQKILLTHPDNFEGLYLAGLATWKTGDHIAAKQLVEKARKVFPNIEEYGFMLTPLQQRPNADDPTFWFYRLILYKRIEALHGVIISFPKCGRTWLRCFLGHYLLQNQPGDPLEVGDFTLTTPGLPFIDFSHDDYPQWKPVEKFRKNKQVYSDTRVAFLARDPRDVLVSYYFQYVKRGDRKLAEDTTFSGSMSEFIHYSIGGIRSIVGFYNIWAAARNQAKAFEIFTYEKFIENPDSEFRRLIRFLDLPDYGNKSIADSLEFCSFENMRKMEENNTLNNERLQRPKDGDPEGFKVRQGKVGGYRKYLTPKDIEFVDGYINENLDGLFGGYKR